MSLYKKLTHHSPSYFEMILLIIVILSSTYCFKTFGMNKPHYLFHLGDRRPASTNIGWGYWSGSQSLRMKYANTNEEIYAHMVIHDG
jgi:hypothetical protein